MADPVLHTAPSLGRDALSGRLERALSALEGQPGPATSWRRAWLLTAVGRYGQALAACEEALNGPPLIQASAKMVEAMLYRQVALHDRAEEADDRALEILSREGLRSKPVRAAIRVGQVADAVGMGADDATLTRRLKVAAAAVTIAGSWRQHVRMTWVRGEVFMVHERFGRAGNAFGAGAKIAAGQGARRHEAKSLIFLAAASAARGQDDEARRMAARGLQLAVRCGAAPLVWPAELILAQVEQATAAKHLERARTVADGLIRTLPADLRTDALQRPPATWLLAGESPASRPATTGPSGTMDLATDA